MFGKLGEYTSFEKLYLGACLSLYSPGSGSWDIKTYGRGEKEAWV